jgi:hypothetical protein
MSETATLPPPALNAEIDAGGTKTCDASSVTGPGIVTPAASQETAPPASSIGNSGDGAGKSEPAPSTIGKADAAGLDKKTQAKSDKRKPRAASQKASRERMTQAGAIRIENEELLRDVPLYCTTSGQWYAADGRGGFARIPDSQAKTLLAEYGFNKNAKDGQGNTPAERAMIWVTQNNRVAFAGSLAGYPAGVHESGGIRFLVTESPAFVTPKPGKCDTIRTLVE